MTGADQGKAEVKVTAVDPDGESASQVFGVTVPNRRPEVVTEITGREVDVGYDTEVTLADHFADPDGDPLTFGSWTRGTAYGSTEDLRPGLEWNLVTRSVYVARA